MAEVAVGAMVIGTAVSIYGNHKKSKAEEAALRARAEAKEVQASVLLERLEDNMKLMKIQGKSFIEDQAASFAAGNVEVGTGSPLMAYERSLRIIESEMARETKETMHNVNMLRAGADIDIGMASKQSQISSMETAGLFFQGVGGVASSLSNRSSSRSTKTT